MSHELLFEIGAEELPPGMIAPALEQLAQDARAGLTDLRLEFEAVRTLGGPRRLALLVSGLAERGRDRDEEVTGPSWKAAFDAAGQPTPALKGFCQGRGIDPAQVRKVTTPKGDYVGATVHHVGRVAGDVLPALLTGLATKLQFAKTMRWLDDDTRFARPVRWLVALLDDRTLPARAFGLEAGRDSRGHRFLARGKVPIAHARDYEPALEQARVLVDPARRRARLEQQIAPLAAQVGGAVLDDPELLEINTYLAEWPTAFLGAFDPRYVDLPVEVIVTALREHQRYFAVTDRARPETLLPSFIAVRDGDVRGLDQVRRGNQAVLTARLEDAEFYWRTDVKRPLDLQIEALANVVWMEGLGSLRDKAARLESLTAWLGARLAPAAATAAGRAALLCKTDLTSEMIGSGKEYAELQGVIGAYYARAAGESAEVSAAIREHYRPAGAGDALPGTAAGTLLALADKLDHVAGAFVGGKIPKGSEDPYGVRRAGNGVIRILLDGERSLDLYATSIESTRILFAADPDLPHAEIMKRLGEFWRGRIETALDERRIAYDVRDAALEARPVLENAGRTRPGWIDPWDAYQRARALAAFRADQRFEPLAILFKRVSNILKAATEPVPPTIDRALLHDEAERALATALDRAQTTTDPLWQKSAFPQILPVLLDLEQPIHTFFDQVLVNAEDPPLRANRLALLSQVRALFLRGWDISKAVVEGDRTSKEPAAKS